MPFLCIFIFSRPFGSTLKKIIRSHLLIEKCEILSVTAFTWWKKNALCYCNYKCLQLRPPFFYHCIDTLYQILISTGFLLKNFPVHIISTASELLGFRLELRQSEWKSEFRAAKKDNVIYSHRKRRIFNQKKTFIQICREDRERSSIHHQPKKKRFSTPTRGMLFPQCNKN